MNLPDAPFANTSCRLGLYPVVDSLTWINRMLDSGVTSLQLRIKHLAAIQLEKTIVSAISLSQQYPDAKLFINDYWQLAIKHQAYGVHLGQEDLSTADLSAMQAAGLRLGISTHDEQKLAQARQIRPSYIALGHIFPTQTKQMPSSPQGLAALKHQVKNTPDYPTVAIGGISIERVLPVLACGVGGVAVVSAITKAADWRQATAALLRLIENQGIADG